jgi:hypothetical protein
MQMNRKKDSSFFSKYFQYKQLRAITLISFTSIFFAAQYFSQKSVTSSSPFSFSKVSLRTLPEIESYSIPTN